MMYNKVVIDNFFSIKHAGEVSQSSLKAVVSKTRFPKPAETVEFSLLCTFEGKIIQARFKAQGHPFLIAGLEWLCAEIEGSVIHQHPHYSYQDFMEVLSMPTTAYATALRLVNIYKESVEQMQEKLSRG